MKHCTKCGVEKPLDAFAMRAGGRTRSACKECEASAERARYEARTGKEPEAARIAGAEQFGTPLQRASAEAFIRLGSIAAAADELRLTPMQLRAHLSELERRAAARGWSPGDSMTRTVPAGYHVKGVSTLYGPEGEIRGQWVKSQRDPEDRLATLADAVQRIAEPFAGLADPVDQPQLVDHDLLCVYPMGDPHFGMFSWAAETGADFDLKVAERDLVAAVDSLVDVAPPAEEALLIDLGDFFHTDNGSNQTARSHHALDVDSRWSKILAVGIRAKRRAIDRLLEKHARVRVICEIGNHDDHSAIMLALCLANYYEREPRVSIDTSPAPFHWYRFGANLIGVTHGNNLKKDQLPGVMATDRARDWGETRHRYWYTGHVHHESVKEYPGVVVETFRTLAPRDAWHNASGYRAGQDMRCDVLHREFGRIKRHIIGIDQIYARREKP